MVLKHPVTASVLPFPEFLPVQSSAYALLNDFQELQRIQAFYVSGFAKLKNYAILMLWFAAG